MHVLLTKADKLKRQAAATALQRARRDLQEIASVQLFSALSRQGLEPARQALAELLAGRQKKASGAEYRGTPEAKSTGLG